MTMFTFELRGDCIGDLRLSKEGEVFFRNSLPRNRDHRYDESGSAGDEFIDNDLNL